MSTRMFTKPTLFSVLCDFLYYPQTNAQLCLDVESRLLFFYHLPSLQKEAFGALPKSVNLLIFQNYLLPLQSTKPCSKLLTKRFQGRKR